MFKYVELCVDMRKGRFAKDGLIQYRIICQQVNVSSLEEVIKHFMHLSTEKAEQARSQAQALEEALDVDDLEADKRPEDLMLSYVSGEKGKERSDRELVTPWFKFLWETYRTVLEILRNNSKLEALYAVSLFFFFLNWIKAPVYKITLCFDGDLSKLEVGRALKLAWKGEEPHHLSATWITHGIPMWDF